MNQTEKTMWRLLPDRRFLSIFLFSVFFSLQALAQGVMIKGVVADATGEGMPGVSILEKGTSNGCITDIDGAFSLTVSGNSSVLSFSYIGYTSTEETVGSRRVINVVLKEDTELLDEVVVVGYGTQKKATVTGSVASVKGDDLKASGVANVTNMFAGQLAGVIATNRTGEPGADMSTILIRGKGTLHDNSPLIVIDGVANRSGLERLNPNDIESINVLKDASASIYGAQAANGVILVTTKRGKTSKPTISYNGNYSISQFTRTPNLLNAYEFMNYSDEISTYKGQNPVFANIKGGYLDGTIDRNRYGDTDWIDAVYRDFAPQTRHSLSASGGSEKVKFHISGDYTYQEPNYRNTEYSFKTTQLRSNIDAQITTNLKVGLDLALRREKRNNPIMKTGTIFWETFQAYPYLYDYYPNGLPGPGIEKGNNLALIVSGKDTGYDRVEDIFLDSKMSFELDLPWITKGLSLSGYAAIDRRFRDNKYFMNTWDTYTYDSNKEEYIKRTGNINDSSIYLSQEHKNYRSKAYHLKLNYDRTFGDHRIGAFVAYEQSETYDDNFWASRKHFLSSNPNFLDFGADLDKNNGGKALATARQNYFGRLNYGYKERYLFEFTLRHDGSMNFASGHRWGTFPGISVGWRLSEEQFMKDAAPFINDLKIRASWGKLGNDVSLDSNKNPIYFQYLSTFNIDNGAILGEDPKRGKGFYPGRIGNPYITWEKVDSKNIAVDGTFWNGLLSFTAEYFHQLRKDILTPKQASIPNYTGLTLPDQNIGEVRNHGIELMVNHRNKIGDINYYIGGNFTFAKNKIKYFDESPNIPEWQRQTGGSMGRWIMYKTDGILQSWEEVADTPQFNQQRSQPGDIRYIDVDESGYMNENDRVYSKYSNTPEIVYGINMGVEWKGWSLSMLWTGQGRVQQMIVPYSFNIHKTFYNNRWTSAEDTPRARYPRAFDHSDRVNTWWSEKWLYDASFLRLKNAEIAYNLPKAWLESAKIEHVRIYLTGNNLFVFDHIKFQDPESDATAWGQKYPQSRTYTVGVNVTF